MNSPSSAGAPPALPQLLCDPAFRRRRTQNWLVLGFLYAFFYMTRYNFAAVMSNLSALFGWTNTQLGVFETMMPLVYGLSVVLNGPLSDRIGGKKCFLFGAVGVTLMNFAFGACLLLVRSPAVMEGAGHAAKVVTPAVLRLGLSPREILTLMAVIWGVNGYFQSFGALSIVKVNAHWFHVRERGTFAGIFGVLIRFGLILAFSGVPWILAVLPLPFAFWLPGVGVGALFLMNLFMMQDSPKDAGFADLDTGDEAVADAGPARVGEILRKVFANPDMWMIALCSMMIGMVRRSTIDSWWPKYFKDIHGIASTAAPYQATVWGIAVLGILGGFAFGIASDRVYDGRRAPVIAFGFVGMVVVLLGFGFVDRTHALGPWAAAVFLPLLSFFVNGAHGMIGGAASMDFGGKKAAATAAGLFDGMQYLASSLVGIGMGEMLDRWGWSAWQFAPIPFAVVGALVISRLWDVAPGRRTVAPAAAPAAEPAA